MDVFFAIVHQFNVDVASVSIECVFNCLSFNDGFMGVFIRVSLLVNGLVAMTKIPEKHAATVECPNGFLWRERILDTECRRNSIDDFSREKQNILSKNKPQIDKT